VVCLLAAITIPFVIFASKLRIQTNFFDLYPPKHPYIQLYKKYRETFGSANVLVVGVERKGSTIYNVGTLEKIDRITRFLLATPGVDPSQVVSITSPRLKNVEVSSWGIRVTPAIHPALPRDQEGFDKLREVIDTNPGIRGFYVSDDDKAAAVYAGFWEETTDLGALFRRLEQLRRTESDADHEIYITGYPMLFAWVSTYLPLTAAVTIATVGATAILLWFYFRLWMGVWVPLFSAALSALWGLGFAGALGLDLDPLALVIFFLISARVLSHSVQSVERYHVEYQARRDKTRAIAASYGALFAPAVVSVVADCLAILTLATASIALIQHLAYIASFWIASIAISVITVHPILLSYLSAPLEDSNRGKRQSDRLYNAISLGLAQLAKGRARYWTVALLTVASAIGIYLGQSLRVGDVTIGKALLYPDHPYNQASDFMNRRFVGTTQLIVVAEGDRPGAIQDRATLQRLQEFEWFMQQDANAGGAISIADMIARLFREYHEGEPRWSRIPYDPRHIAEMFYLLESSTAPGDMSRLFSSGYRSATATVYYRDYSNENLKEILRRAAAFMDARPLPNVHFNLAGGLVGIVSAVNEEIERCYRVNLFLVLLMVFIPSVIAYRSVAGAAIVMTPSLAAVPLTEAVMRATGIDMNLNSLPVVAVGIGIGIDYGFYVLSRIMEELAIDGDIDEANRRALLSTGRAILFTGTTLIASVGFWLWFPMKFQAEMAFLLVTVLLLHVVGALVFIPALASLLRPDLGVDYGRATCPASEVPGG
jgi:uncharacterized protein